MRKNLFDGVFIVLTLLLFTACQEEMITEVDDPVAAEREGVADFTDDERATYHYKHMKTLAKGILYQSNNPEFRELLYRKVSERFDGEPNVLIELLAESYGKDQLYSQIQREFEQHDIAENFEDGLRAFDFRGITGERLFPHVFIPFFEEEQPNISVRKSTSERSTPVILIENPLIETDAEPGYTLNEKGDFVKMDTLITEQYARENEVWVLAQNERVVSLEQARSNAVPIECEGRDCPPPPRPDPNPPTNPPSGPRTCDDGTSNGNIPDNGIAVYVKKMRIVTHKESWYRGGSEVEIAVTTSVGTSGAARWWQQVTKTIGDSYLGYVTVPHVEPEGHYGLRSVSRDDVKSGKQFRINQNITIANWKLPERNRTHHARLHWGARFDNASIGDGGNVVDPRKPYMIWAVYEHDSNGGRKSATVDWYDPIVQKRSARVTFPSRDGAYDEGVFFRNPNSPAYPCEYNTYTPINRDNYFFFTTGRGTREANFNYDE